MATRKTFLSLLEVLLARAMSSEGPKNYTIITTILW